MRNLSSRQYCRTILLLSALVPSVMVSAQPTATSSPEATADYARGMAAAQQQNWDLAIKYFGAALDQSSDPVILKNLGLAYDKAEGRELIAICYYHAFIDAQPTGPDSGPVQSRITELEVKVESNMRTLADEVDKAAEKLPPSISRSYALWSAAGASAAAGNIARAQEILKEGGNSIPDAAPAYMAVYPLYLLDFQGAADMLSGVVNASPENSHLGSFLAVTPDAKIIPFSATQAKQASDFLRSAEHIADKPFAWPDNYQAIPGTSLNSSDQLDEFQMSRQGNFDQDILAYLAIGQRFLGLGDVVGAQRAAKKGDWLLQGDVSAAANENIRQQYNAQFADLQSQIASAPAKGVPNREADKIAWQVLAQRLIEQKPSKEFRYITEAPADFAAFLKRVEREAADWATAGSGNQQASLPNPDDDMVYGIEDLALGLSSVRKQMLIRVSSDKGFVVVP
jgi:tetratricopeptide (TPR) repeat protein